MPLEPIIITITIIIILMHVLNVFFTANITSHFNSQSLRPELKIKTIFKRMGGFCVSSQNQIQYNFVEFLLLIRESVFDTQTKNLFRFVNTLKYILNTRMLSFIAFKYEGPPKVYAVLQLTVQVFEIL